MKQHTVTTFSLAELSDKAKEKARSWYREGQFEDSSWADSTIEEVIAQGKLLGITFDTYAVRPMGGGTREQEGIWWSGFHSQGDGACFDGTWNACDVRADKVAEDWGDSPATTEIKRIAAALAGIAKSFPEASLTVKHTGHYYHRFNTDITADFGIEEADGSEAEMNEAEASLTELVRDFMLWIYKQLEDEYNHLNSDEAVDESIEANDYQFYEDGSRAWRHD